MKKLCYVLFITLPLIGAQTPAIKRHSPLTQLVQELLTPADIIINGSRPWDITVHNENLYQRVLTQGSLGLGQAYMEGWWDCQHLDVFFTKLMAARVDQTPWQTISRLSTNLYARLFNQQSADHAFEAGEQHYDISNELYRLMLDRNMIYSCGYWKNANNLDDAQIAKLDLICKKLHLKPGMKLLDIGCGFGTFARYAAQHYGVEVVGITISKEQAALGKELCAGLAVEIRLQDYRDLKNEQFDRIASIGMFEHVGIKNYRTFFEVAHRCLKDDGLFLLHSIGENYSQIAGDPWIDRYIFPNAVIPSIKQIAEAFEGLFTMEDWHNFGADYDKTLMAWHANFNVSWPQLSNKFNNTFYRMWNYYLLSCAGMFRSRRLQLWQIVLTKNGAPGGYVCVR